MTLVQLTRQGAVRVGTGEQFAAARAEFDRRHCLLLNQLIEPSLLSLGSDATAAASTGCSPTPDTPATGTATCRAGG